VNTLETRSDVEHLAAQVGLDAGEYYDAQLHTAVGQALQRWPLIAAIYARFPPPPASGHAGPVALKPSLSQ
jgi:hypothetical protein